MTRYSSQKSTSVPAGQARYAMSPWRLAWRILRHYFVFILSSMFFSFCCAGPLVLVGAIPSQGGHPPKLILLLGGLAGLLTWSEWRERRNRPPGKDGSVEPPRAPLSAPVCRRVGPSPTAPSEPLSGRVEPSRTAPTERLPGRIVCASCKQEYWGGLNPDGTCPLCGGPANADDAQGPRRGGQE